MRPGKREKTGSGDLFRSRLDQIINMRHELVRLADAIDWEWIDEEVGALFSDEGRPGTESRFMIGLLLLKHIHGLSDEVVCERWVENPYFQYFTGEEFFCHTLAHERSGLTHWRSRIGPKLDVLLAGKHGVALRQSYVRVAKRAALMAGRYAHAKQFKRMNRELKFLRTRLGRLIRDIRRKIEDDEGLQEIFEPSLSKAMQIRRQRQNQRGWKLYSWHAPETECIGKGKAHRPYEFGVKVSITTTNRRCKGGQFVLHAKALPGNPYDGHTLADVIAETQALTGREIERIYVDKGYRGHGAPKPLTVFLSGQKRGVHGVIKKELRRRSAIEAAIGHMKNEGHFGRNYLKGRIGDHVNAVLTAVGYNFHLILSWLRILLPLILNAIWQTLAGKSALKAAS